jgi:hypothetical protein
VSKSHRKRKQRRSTPNLPPIVMLRPRLDELLGDKTLIKKDSQVLKTDLSAVFKGLDLYEFLPVLLRACANASTQVQARLDAVVPEWLGERGYLGSLFELLEQGRASYEDKDRRRVVTWLRAAGADVSGLQEPQAEECFYQAYMYADESQGVIIVLWYTDSRRRKVRGMNFLVDFNPPWEGAVKDIAVFPQGSPDRVTREYVDFWTRRGLLLKRLSASEVKREILECLEVNRHEGIRLPRDLIRARDLFLEHVLSLPDLPDTPPFTAEDFDTLASAGETPESLSHFEQTVGRRVRMEDGQEVFIMGKPFDEDE